MSNKYFRKYYESAANTPHILYTVPAANSAIISSLRVTNDDGGEARITVTVNPAGGAGYKILQSAFLPVNGTMDVFSGIPCVLEATDELEVQSTQANVFFYLSYLEMDRS